MIISLRHTPLFPESFWQNPWPEAHFWISALHEQRRWKMMWEVCAGAVELVIVIFPFAV